jgi:hypothetical protein
LLTNSKEKPSLAALTGKVAFAPGKARYFPKGFFLGSLSTPYPSGNLARHWRGRHRLSDLSKDACLAP